MATLRFLEPDGRLRWYELGSDPCIIGRVAGVQIVFPDDMVSREHARIERDGDGRHRIRDLGSRNKTFVNGQMVAETLLAGGDIVRIGDHILEYVDDLASGVEPTLDFLTPDRKDPAGTEWIRSKAPVQLTLELAGQLVGVSQVHSVMPRPEDVAETAIARLLLDLQADRGLIAVRGEEKKQLKPVAQRGLVRPPGGSLMPVSETFLYSAFLQNASGRYPQQASQIDPKAGYAAVGMVAPLLHRNEVVGVVYVDRPITKQPFSAMALQYLAAAGAQIGNAMAEAARRTADMSARDGAAWLNTLRRAQASFGTVLKPTEALNTAAKTLPGKMRCGDLFDIMMLDDHSFCAILLDAGGQGIIGMAQAASIRAALRVALPLMGDLTDLGQVMSGISRTIAEQKARQLVQCVALGVNLRSGRVTYVNAGASAPLLMSGPSRLVTLDQGSLLLGIDPTYEYEATTTDLPAEFRLIVHSDGLVEATNGSAEAFGSERLHELLLQRESFDVPPVIVDRVLTAVSNHVAGQGVDDDATVLVLGA